MNGNVIYKSASDVVFKRAKKKKISAAATFVMIQTRL